MGLLNNENEDVTNVTSESSNPYTSLKYPTHSMEMECILDMTDVTSTYLL